MFLDQIDPKVDLEGYGMNMFKLMDYAIGLERRTWVG
jgi:hypothetical protein